MITDPGINGHLATNVIPSTQIVFKYCFEIDRVPRRDSQYVIDVKPSSQQGPIFIFRRDDILSSLENEDINQINIRTLKYFNENLKSWIEVPEQMFVNMIQQAQDTEQAQIVELLIREGQASKDVNNSSMLANIQHKPVQRLALPPAVERSNLDVEREMNTLKERMNYLEALIETKHFVNDLSTISSRIQSTQIAEEAEARALKLVSSSELDNNSNSTVGALPSNDKKRKSKHDYLKNHQSEVLQPNKHTQQTQTERAGNTAKKSKSTSHESNKCIVTEKKDTTIDSSIAHRDQLVSESSDQSQRDDDDGSESYENSRQNSEISLKSGFNSSHKQLSDSPNHKIKNHKYQSKKRKLDFAFLYADPLVERLKGQLKPFNAPIDTEIEYRQIFKFLQQCEKHFVIRKEAANFEILKQIISSQPQIIHISCHGDYEEKMKKFYLAFEEKNTGILDQLNEDRLTKLLGDGSNHQVQLVFVSACHSEMIGKIFLKAKIPVVVAVNSHTMILDEVCQLFARHFYSDLLNGYTPKEAFENGKSVVQCSNIDTFSCCCAHDHKPYCKWEKYAKKNGYEKAHQLHMPNCSCSDEKSDEKNKHYIKCSFYQNYVKELANYEDLTSINIDDFDLSYEDKVSLCCCQSDIPHDETIKFIINGSEVALNTPIFHKRKVGELIFDQDANQMNKLQHFVDPHMLVGRNIVLQKLSFYLFSDSQESRFIHLHGSEGLGKSAIANYAAKYTLDRRKFTDGVYFIEIQNRNSDSGLISKICQKLRISNCSKEQLCEIIKSSHILIILDKCQKMIEQSKGHFNNTLNYLVKNTMHTKLLVISYKKDDIEQQRFKKDIQIDVLSKTDAVKLLFMAAGDCKNLKEFKSESQLSKHKIFQLISYKPTGILQIASLLQHKTLDQIVKEKEEHQNKEELQKSQDDKSLEFGEFSFIMNISYTQLKSKLQTEIKLLYAICQFPAGLFQTDIEIISKQYQYGEWEKFIQTVSQDDKLDSGNKQNVKPKDVQSIQSRKNFRMIISNFSEELSEEHYIAQPIVSEYINKMVLNQKQYTIHFTESFKYMATLSRKLIRSLKHQKKYEIDLQCVSSEIDLGIWKDNLTIFPLSDEEIEMNMVYNPESKFNFYEPNFIGLLDIEVLKIQFQKLDLNTSLSQSIDELCINISSILIMLDRFDEALLCIQKCRDIATHFDIKIIKAKANILEASILIKQKCTFSDVNQILDKSEKIFLEFGFKDGTADAIFLKAIALINSITLKSQSKHDESKFSQYNSHNSIERSKSDDNGSLIHKRAPNFPKLSFSNTTFHQPSNQITPTSSGNYVKQVQHEIQRALAYLYQAREFYIKAYLDYGVAKVDLIVAEFQIEKSYGCGITIEYDAAKIANLLGQAIELFKKYKQESLIVRCLRNLAVLKFRMDEFQEAKRIIEDALNYVKKIQDKHQEGLCSEILNQILDEIRIKSNNVFIFAKAFPLVEVMSQDNVKIVGQFTRYPQDFKTRVHTEIMKINKVVNLKFDILSRELLEYVKQHGCRVLHLSSDMYDPDYLCVEGKNGLIEYISLDELKTLLKPENSKLNVDVVVLAIPESSKIANIFVEIGVPHVIAFDFEHKLLSKFMDNVYTLPKRYDYIYDFCVEFYKNLIMQEAVVEACKKAKTRINDGLSKVSNQCININLTQEDVGRGPILFPETSLHQDKLFDSESYKEKFQLKQGPYIESSRVRGPTNINQEKLNTPYTGRQIETYKIMKLLKNQKIKVVNLVGLGGIGKTRFVQEVSYYISTRYEFQEGIFIVNLRKVKTVEQIKQKLMELNIGGGQNQELNSGLQKKNILLIFDNIDTILKQNKTQFDWFLISLIQNSVCLKLILTSKKPIKAKEYQCIEQSIGFFKLKPLNDIEAVDMVLSQCTRQITAEEFHMTDERSYNIHRQLQQEASIKKCQGFPKYLEFFTKYLNKHSFDEINIKNYILNSKQKKIEQLLKEQDQQSLNKTDQKGQAIQIVDHKKNICLEDFDEQLLKDEVTSEIDKNENYSESSSGGEDKDDGIPFVRHKFNLGQHISSQGKNGNANLSSSEYEELIKWKKKIKHSQIHDQKLKYQNQMQASVDNKDDRNLNQEPGQVWMYVPLEKQLSETSQLEVASEQRSRANSDLYFDPSKQNNAQGKTMSDQNSMYHQILEQDLALQNQKMRQERMLKLNSNIGAAQVKEFPYQDSLTESRDYQNTFSEKILPMTSLAVKDIPFLPQDSIGSEILEEQNEDSSTSYYEDSKSDELSPDDYENHTLTKQISMFTSSSSKNQQRKKKNKQQDEKIQKLQEKKTKRREQEQEIKQGGIIKQKSGLFNVLEAHSEVE